MTVASLASALITVFEGCKLASYWDKTGKVWTIGFGHTHGVAKGDVTTMEQATSWLAEDEAALLELVKGRSTVEAASLVSFGYNCGEGALKRLLAGEISMATYGRSSGGKVLAGLVARRNLEQSLIEASRII